MIYLSIFFYTSIIRDGYNPKRQLTEKQLEKLAKARAKANEARQKNYAIKKFEKENEKYEKEKELQCCN